MQENEDYFGKNMKEVTRQLELTIILDEFRNDIEEQLDCEMTEKTQKSLILYVKKLIRKYSMIRVNWSLNKLTSEMAVLNSLTNQIQNICTQYGKQYEANVSIHTSDIENETKLDELYNNSQVTFDETAKVPFQNGIVIDYKGNVQKWIRQDDFVDCYKGTLCVDGSVTYDLTNSVTW